MYSGGMRASV